MRMGHLRLRRITRNSYDFRPLGLGYANLGALLMARGLPYDSDAGRAYAAAVTALMTGQAYLTSAKIATKFGDCIEFSSKRLPIGFFMIPLFCLGIDATTMPTRKIRKFNGL